MKTKNNRLNFTKNEIVELNEGQLSDIQGGTTGACATISIFIASVALSHQLTQVKLRF